MGDKKKQGKQSCKN